MRQAGTLASEPDARRFGDYLLTLGIHARVEPYDGQWAVWVIEEGDLPRSKQELAEFVQQPLDARYERAEQEASALRRQSKTQAKKIGKNVIELRDQWSSPVSRRTPVTIALIGLSVLVAVLTHLGKQPEPVAMYLFISTHLRDLSDVFHGEVWRLITPIFLHYGLFHLLFNMYWLFALGAAIEILEGSGRLVFLVVAIAIASNLGQYFYSGAGFGGMSGVVYGLFGYSWMKSRYDPNSRLFMPQSTVFLMVAWLFLCMTPAVDIPVANAAHAVGLAAGLAIGLAPRLRR